MDFAYVLLKSHMGCVETVVCGGSKGWVCTYTHKGHGRHPRRSAMCEFTPKQACIHSQNSMSIAYQSRTRMFSSSHSWHGSKPFHWFQQSPIAPHDNFMVYLGSNISISTTDKPICSQITPRDAQCVPWGFPGQGSSKLFTALFTSRDPGLPVSSSAGYGPF